VALGRVEDAGSGLLSSIHCALAHRRQCPQSLHRSTATSLPGAQSSKPPVYLNSVWITAHCLFASNSLDARR
jgi:hypothetical protein